MVCVLFVTASLVAVFSTTAAAPMNTPSLNSLSVPTDLNLGPEYTRAQTREILDDLLSRFPTLVDSLSSVFQTQQLLPTNSLQNLRVPQLPQLASSLQLPKINDVLPSIPGLPSLPGLSGVDSETNSQIPTVVDAFLTNIRSIATQPLQLAPPRPVRLGGTPIESLSNSLAGSLGLDLPPMNLPMILSFPNKEGLSDEELIKSIQKKIRDQSEPSTDGSLWAQFTIDPLAMNKVMDFKPLHPLKAPGATPKKDSNKPVRRTLGRTGGLLGGNTEVQIYMTDLDKPALESNDDIRMGLTTVERNLAPVTYPTRA